MNTFQQGLSYGDFRWPSGIRRSAALLRLTPEAVTDRTGLAFDTGVDELDYFRAAGVDLPSGRHVALVWHERAPVKALEVRIDASNDPTDARTELMQALGITEGEVLWHPDPNMRAI